MVRPRPAQLTEIVLTHTSGLWFFDGFEMPWRLHMGCGFLWHIRSLSPPLGQRVNSCLCWQGSKTDILERKSLHNGSHQPRAQVQTKKEMYTDDGNTTMALCSIKVLPRSTIARSWNRGVLLTLSFQCTFH